jgi:hypothetical protein
MNKSTASMAAGSSEGGARGFPAIITAGLSLTGIYHGICRGYKSEHAAEYLREWPRLLQMRAKRDWLVRLAPAFMLPLFDRFMAELADFERYMEGLTEVKWADDAPNLVTTVGANLALDTVLAGSAYTVTGPYMFLIGAVSYVSVPVIADTMSSHATWTEAGGTNAPTYSGSRPTVSWNSAASKSKSPSSAPVFTMTGSGTAKGVGLVLGSGASATKDNTSGVLYSAGLFSGGDQAVVSTNTLSITYSATA